MDKENGQEVLQIKNHAGQFALEMFRLLYCLPSDSGCVVCFLEA